MDYWSFCFIYTILAAKQKIITMHKFDFINRTAVITGGAQGFGLDVAKRFLESGAKVFIWDIDEKLLKSVVDEIKNPSLEFNVVDVANYKDVEKNVSQIIKKKKY